MGMDNGPRASFPVETSVHGKVARGPVQGVLQPARHEVPPPKLLQRSASARDDDPRPVEDREVPFRAEDLGQGGAARRAAGLRPTGSRLLLAGPGGRIPSADDSEGGGPS